MASAAGRDEAPVVICYDGSVEAEAALELVSELLAGARRSPTLPRAVSASTGNAKNGVKATVPTILPNALVQRSSKPVLVVPSPKAAAERRREIEKD